jgi:AraC-like DNA-binding protein
VRREKRFDFQWHFHREYELTLITKGSGTRLVGDGVQDYAPGDLTLIGPEVPHTYVSKHGFNEHEALVVQFRPNFLGRDIFRSPEFIEVAAMLERSACGLSFPCSATMLNDLVGLTDLDPAYQTLTLLQILVRLSACSEARPLAGTVHLPALNQAAEARIGAVVHLLHTEYARPMSLDEVAAAAHMSPSSTSRFFRRAMGVTITNYLNALRVDAACRLLRDTDQTVADIAADCGYANLSNFNRRFRELRGMSPREYRLRMTGLAAHRP